MQIAEVLEVLRKHWAWIIACIAATCAGAAAWTWTRPLVYEAAALIEVEPGANPLVDDRTQAFETHRYLLKSRPNLEAVSDKLDRNPEFLENHVLVEHIPDTHILRITAQADSPQLAANIANGLADQYVLSDAQRRVEASERLVEWLQGQMVDIKAQVERSELALIEYVETAELDLVELAPKDDESSGKSLRGSPVLADLQLALGEAELKLEYAVLDFTEEHPTVIRLRQEIEILRRRIGAERKRIASENKKRIRYDMLRRDADLNREMFAVFTRELKRVNLMGDDPVDRIQVQERAIEPVRPIAPNRAQNLVLGALVGLLLGVGLAFLHETLDRTLRRVDEIEKASGLPVLATVHRKVIPRGERFLVHPQQGWGRELEDFRALRTSIRYARAEGENHTIEVTSALPREGKTTIVTNLAMVMGQTGERVLIVDADLRRPAVHTSLGIENEHGLTNLLAEGERDPLSVVRTTEFPNIFVITAGAHAPNPPELLESDAMKRAVETWRTEFDRVIFDTPPVGSVVDPRILAPLVDGVILLVSTGRVDAETVQSARSELGSVGAKFFGVVVNQLSKGGDGYYGYDYYHSSDEERSSSGTDDDDRAQASG